MKGDQKKSGFLIALIASILVSGCASIPDVSVRHFLPEGTLSLRTVRTVGCSKDLQGVETLHVASAVTALPSYASDLRASETIRLARLNGAGSNSNLTFGFFDDGRLRSINSTSEGVGQEIVASAIKVAGLVLGVPGPGLSGGFTQACALIREQQTDKAPVTITSEYRESFIPANYTTGTERWVVLPPNPADPTFTQLITGQLPLICARFGPVSTVAPAVVQHESSEPDIPHVRLRQPARVSVRVVQETVTAFRIRRENLGSYAETAPCGADIEVIWEGTMAVPQLGSSFDVPIPTTALFGKTNFQLALAESGTITSLGYGDSSGAPAVLTSAAGVISAFESDSAAIRAAAAQGEADLIYQQNRLVRCQMDRQNCPQE